MAESASAAARGSRAKEEASSTASVSRRRRTSASSPPHAASGSRGMNSAISTPGGPSLVRASRPGSSIAAHRLSAVWREPTSTALAGASPSRAYGRKRSGCGLTVYSSAEPWTLTAYGTPSSARASTAGPITRWLASATSGRTGSATSRTAATLRSR